MHYISKSSDSEQRLQSCLSCDRQDLLVKKLQQENRELRLNQERNIEKGVLQERKRVKKIHDRQKQNKRISTKAASLAGVIVVGYYMIASELNLWIISEQFSRSEWTQAIITSIVVWLIEQVYHANE